MTPAETVNGNARPTEALKTPTGLAPGGVAAIADELRRLLADVFTLYVKTKNFHWHMSGIHFRDFHLLLDGHSEQVSAMTDDIAERARKIGGRTIRSIGDIARHRRLSDNDAEFVGPFEMLAELAADNRSLTASLRIAHSLCDQYGDVATASLIENWIDQAEQRTWFLTEIVGDRFG